MRLTTTKIQTGLYKMTLTNQVVALAESRFCDDTNKAYWAFMIEGDTNSDWTSHYKTKRECVEEAQRLEDNGWDGVL